MQSLVHCIIKSDALHQEMHEPISATGWGGGGVLDAWLKVSRDFLVLLTVWPDALAIENVAAAFKALLGGRKSDKMRGNLCCLFFLF